MEKLGMRGSHTQDANVFALKNKEVCAKKHGNAKTPLLPWCPKVLFNKTGRQRERDSKGSKGELKKNPHLATFLLHVTKKHVNNNRVSLVSNHLSGSHTLLTTILW